MLADFGFEPGVVDGEEVLGEVYLAVVGVVPVAFHGPDEELAEVSDRGVRTIPGPAGEGGLGHFGVERRVEPGVGEVVHDVVGKPGARDVPLLGISEHQLLVRPVDVGTAVDGPEHRHQALLAVLVEQVDLGFVLAGFPGRIVGPEDFRGSEGGHGKILSLYGDVVTFPAAGAMEPVRKPYP